MGKLILCSGSRTNRPYVFSSTGIRVYSIEELCWYLYNYVYMLDQELFTDSLFDWIGTELKLNDRADKLRALKSQNADMKTIVTVILCSADYYTEEEIKSLLKILDQIIGMPPIKRNCIKANTFLKKNQFSEASGEYERIINSKEAAELTPEEYGDILHNLAVAKVHLKGASEASEIFLQAYQRNLKEESLRQYLFTLIIGNNQELFYKKAEEYQVSQELCNAIVTEMELLEKEAQDIKRLPEIHYLRQYKSEGRISDFYKIADDLIERWKTSIRQVSYGDEG
ncbi:MAG TPA: hypothetical protein VN131_02005 [Mobilitalea sp.]|nr:hypothetical protein [Mobilitalea sp.]